MVPSARHLTYAAAEVSMDEILHSIVVVVIVAIIVLVNVALKKNSARYWSRVARHFGLRLVDGGFLGGLTMSGTIEGIDVSVETETRGGSRSKRTVTVVRARPNRPMPANMHLSTEGYGDGVMKMLGAQDIPLASRRHDEALLVKGKKAGAVQGLLNHPEARPALDLLKDERGRLVFEDGAFSHELHGDGGRRLAVTIQSVVGAALALDRAAAGPWKDAAVELGLRYGERNSAPFIEGTLSGLKVEAYARWLPSKYSFCVSLRGGLPHGVRLRAGAGGPLLGDPILDGRLMIESVDTDRDTPPPLEAIAWLKARLQDPRHDLHGCLMDVMQGLEGAVVENGEVTLEQAGGVEPVDVIQRLTALGVALSDGDGMPAGAR